MLRVRDTVKTNAWAAIGVNAALLIPSSCSETLNTRILPELVAPTPTTFPINEYNTKNTSKNLIFASAN
jgi:hypothetical protein